MSSTNRSAVPRWRSAAVVTALAGMISGVVAAAPVVAVAAPPPVTVLGDFESSSEGWEGVSGGGGEGSLSLVADPSAPSGEQVGRVHLTDTSTGYYEIYRAVPSLGFDELSFQIKAPGLTRIVVRVLDINGRAHQTTHLLDGSDAWQAVTVEDPTAGHTYGTWGGDDEIVDYVDPTVQLSLLVDTGYLSEPRPVDLTVLIDDLRLTSPAIPWTEPDGMATLLGGFESGAEGWLAGGDADAVYTREAVTDAPEGSQVGQIRVNDTTAGLYEIARAIPNLAFEALVFDIKAPGLARIVVRLVDATDRVHQTSYALDGSDTWQTIVIEDPTTGPNYVAWGGTDGAGWQDPTARLNLLVDTGFYDSAVDPDALVQIDNVRLYSPVDGGLLSPTTLGNVFVGDAPAVIGYDTAADRLRWTLTDVDGVAVDAGEVTDPAGAGQLSLDIEDGWYLLTATAITDGEAVQTAQTTLARVPGHTAAEDSPFGVATHFGGWWTTDALPLISAAGIATIRDEVYWSALESSPGVYDWSVGSWTDQVAAEGLDLLLIPGYGNRFYDDGDKPLSATAVEAYSDYAAALTERYRDLLVGVEIWNEWDLTLGNTTPGTAESYVDLLAAAAPAVSAKAPELPIIGPAVALLSTTFMEETFRAGALDYLDGIVLHPYSYPASAENLDTTLASIDSLVRQYNDGQALPLWVTEHGWPTGTDVKAVSESEQANNLAKSAAIAVAHDLGQYFWYDFVNDGADDAETEHNFGLVHHATDELGAYTPKPGYVAYATATSMLDSATFIERDESIDGVWNLAYTSGSADADLRVLWAEDAATVGVRSAVPFTVTTTYGTSTEYPATGTEPVVLQLSDEPLYVSGVIDEVVTDASSLTIEEAYVGRPLVVGWTADNALGDAAATFAIEIDGLEDPVEQTVPAGQTGTVQIMLPAPTATGPVRVSGAVTRDGVPVGTLTAVGVVEDSLGLVGTRALDEEGGELLRFRVTNHAEDDAEITELTWSAGSQSGAAGAGVIVPARSTVIVDVPLEPITAVVGWTARVTTVASGTAISAGSLRPLGTVGDVPAGPITVDGVLDPTDDDPSASLADPNGDLTADAWYRWDADGLSLTVRVDDDVHVQSWTAGEMWQGDSVQFTFAPGAPGEVVANHEFGMALTPSGPQVYRWVPTAQTGLVEDAEVAVNRDDTAQVTVYEVLLPWSELDGWDPTDRLMSTAIAINENDGAGRTWAEWGGGIAGSKDSSLFKAMRTMPAGDPGEGPGEEPGEGPGEGPGEEPGEGPGEEPPGEGPDVGPGEGPGKEPGEGEQPSVVLDVGTVAAGGTIRLSGSGFGSREDVTITLHSDPVQLTTVAADASGSFTATAVVPASTLPGAHTVVVEGTESGLSASAPLTVTAVATMAATGPTTAVLAVVAALLVTAGVTARVRRRGAVSTA